VVELKTGTKELKTTKDYSIFRRLAGNRAVEAKRVRKIVDSIQNVGYITSPIIVNENMEVIDGQGRLEALKKLNLPVDYIVHEGIGIKECVSMNINNTNWKITDYIDSYAEQGNDNYIRIKLLLEEFRFSLMVTLSAIKGTYGAGLGGSSMNERIRQGVFEVTEEEKEQAREKLAFIRQLEEHINYKDLAGSQTMFQIAVIACLNIGTVDREKLFNKIAVYSSLMPPFDCMNNCMRSLEWLYNRNARKDYVYIYTEYRKMVRENMRKGSKVYAEKMRNDKRNMGLVYWEDKTEGFDEYIDDEGENEEYES